MDGKDRIGLEAVISDLDGTLVGVSNEYCLKLFEEVFRTIGIIEKNKNLDEKTAFDLFYNPNREQIIREFYDKKSMTFERESFWNSYQTIEKRKDFLEMRIRDLKVYDDVGILKDFSDKGIKIGIITQSQEEIAFAEIEKIEKEIGLKIKRDFVIHNSSYAFVKPDYRVLEKMIEKMEAKKDIAYIGDSETDLLLINNFHQQSKIKETYREINVLPFIVLREYLYNNEGLLHKNFLEYKFEFSIIKNLIEIKDKIGKIEE